MRGGDLVKTSLTHRGRLVSATLAIGFAVAAYLIANGLELLAVQFINPNLTDIVEVSDFLLAGAAGATLFFWLHLKSTRSELLRLERTQIVVNTQLATAAQIQRRLLPTRPATIDGMTCAVRFEPAWEVGGDFYDFLPLDHERMLIAVGDISGKGIPAAMLLAFARTVLRTGATRTTDPAQLLTLLSNALYEDNGGTPYVTCIVAMVDAAQGIVTYANAGHPPGVIVRSAGASVRVLDTAGPPAGMFDHVVYTSDTRTLNPCDLTILVTDGISEALAQNGTLAESVVNLIARSEGPRQPSTVCETIMAAARSAGGPRGVEDWADDRTVVVFQWDGPTKKLEGGLVYGGLEQHRDVDDDIRPRVVDNGIPVDHAACVALWQRRQLAFDRCGKGFELLLPARRQLATTRDLLLQAGREVAISRCVVVSQDGDVPFAKDHTNTGGDHRPVGVLGGRRLVLGVLVLPLVRSSSEQHGATEECTDCGRADQPFHGVAPA